MYGISLYGVLKYSENKLDSDDVKKFTPNLMKYLPSYYQRSDSMKEIQGVISAEFGLLYYYANDISKQLSLDTATWGLMVYEKELGLESNFNLSYQDRREIIKAKYRGFGTVTKDMIKDTAEAFSGGEVMVYEFPAEYRFVIKFIGVKGIPSNMQSFKNMLEDIKPSHLAYSFEYNYTTCQMLIDWNVSCNDARSVDCITLKVYAKE